MARFVTRFALAIIASAVCIATASQMPAEDSKPVSFALFAPGQSEKTVSALTKLFTQDNKNASVSVVKNLPDAIASKADIVVLALSVKEFNSLGPYDADALKKRKVIGISYGAAKLYGEIGLKISWGACAHGMEPRIKVEDNATIARAGFDKVFGVYAPNAPQYPASDVEYMPFGIFDGFPAIHKGLEDVDVVARFNGDVGYAPIVRQGNKILIGFNPHAEDWSEQFGDLMRKLAAALNEPLKNPGSQPVATHAPQTLEGDWAGPDPERVMRLKNPVSQPVATHAPQSLEGDWAVPEGGRVMRLTRTNDGRSCSIEWIPGFANDSERGFKPTRFDLLGDNVGATELPYGFAMWDHGFKVEYFTARLENDELVLESYSIFKDGSGRSNYRQVGKMKRAANAASDACGANSVYKARFSVRRLADVVPHPEPGTQYRVQSAASSLYLDVFAGNRDVGGRITQANSPEQKWKLEDTGGGKFFIQSTVSGLYLDVLGGNFSNGAKVVQAARNGTASQLWYLKNSDTSGFFFLVPQGGVGKGSGGKDLCLDVRGGAQDAGAEICIATQNWPQAWGFVK